MLPPFYKPVKSPQPQPKPLDAALDAGNDWVRVAQSRLHGLGVFALRAIPPSTFIAQYVGEVLHACPRDRRCVMCVAVDDSTHDYLYIDARDPTASNFTRFLNDPGPGRRANCEFRQHDLCRSGVVLIR